MRLHEILRVQRLTYHDHSRLSQASLLDLICNRRQGAAEHSLVRLSGVGDNCDRAARPVRGRQLGTYLPYPPDR